MIITVTMNPAIDKTVDIDRFIPGGLNRITHVEWDAGGKGINVSKTICELGGMSVATGFIGGDAGAFIEQTLTERGIRTDFIQVSGETRTNTKVVETDGTVTELNEAGPVVAAAQVEELVQKLEAYATQENLIVLSGSVPAGVPKTIYRDIISRVHNKGGRVLLDADGELFVNGLAAGPDIIKPNKTELEEYMDRTAETIPEVLEMGSCLLDKGIGMIAISCGADGAIFLTADERIHCGGLKVAAHSTVGAGDAMVAAISYGYHEGMKLKEIVPLSIATSAGAVTTIGTKPPARELIDILVKDVVIESI